jgi:AcrR family transcriptional regulator
MLSDSGPSGQFVKPTSGSATWVMSVPASVTTPVSGSTVPVKSDAAMGVTVTIASIGFVTATSNGGKVIDACGIESAPDAVTEPTSVPVSGVNSPSGVPNVPSCTLIVTDPGFSTAAPASNVEAARPAHDSARTTASTVNRRGVPRRIHLRTVLLLRGGIERGSIVQCSILSRRGNAVTAQLQVKGHAFVPPDPPRTAKAARTRERLYDAAWQLFRERGYDAVSMRDIGAAAGLTKTGAYGHFRTKGQLLVEVIRSKLAERDASIDFGPLTDFESGVALMYDDRYRDVRLLEVDAAAAARHDPDVAAGLASLYRERHERTRDAIGEVVDPDTTAWIMSTIMAGVGVKDAIGLPQPDSERLAAALVAALTALA